MAKTFSLARFGAEAKGAVARAQKRADALRHARASSLHLLLELCGRADVVADALASIAVDVDALQKRADEVLEGLEADGDGRSFLSKEMIELLRRAEIEAGEGEVGIGDVLNALAQEADGPTRDVLGAFRIRPGAFRAFFARPATAAHEDEGEAMLRDFASEVKTDLRDADERALRERGATLIARLADQLSGRDGIPGLTVVRESERRIKLERLPRDAHVVVEWESDSGAVAIHWRKRMEKDMTRYLWDRSAKRWASIEGGGLYEELRASLKRCLFPEMA